MSSKRTIAVLAMIVVGLSLCDCAKKGSTRGAGDPTAAPGMSMPPDTPLKWSYEVAPTPPFEGTADVRLTSFGFDQGSTEMRPEAVGACREAVKRIQDRPESKLVLIGFADGINEKAGGEELGMRRAMAARGFLTTLGIDATRMQVSSFGALFSTAQDFETIKQGHERKVEVWLLK